MTTKNDLKILERLKSHPELRERFEAIMDVAENKSGALITADQAEGKAIEEVEKLGQELMRDWALKRQEKAIEQAGENHPTAKSHKKNLIYMCSFPLEKLAHPATSLLSMP